MKDTLFKNFSGKVEFEKKLSDLVAYRIGGQAKFFLTPQTPADYELALQISKEKGLPLLILGSGSNLLVSDKAFDGIVLWMGPEALADESSLHVIHETDDSVTLEVPASYSKAQLLDFTLKKKWSGLEFSAGIPGTLGGAVYMNAGTKWGSYGEIIRDVHFYSPKRGHFLLSNKEIGFKYRGHGEGLLDGETVVTKVSLDLKKGVAPSKIFSRIDEIFVYRGQRQPLELPNCGSVFKNPANSEKGAGRLIEACSLKGSSVGGAEVSLKHANFILNRGNAKAVDVYSLIQKVQDKVFEKFQIQLETEVIFIGKF